MVPSTRKECKTRNTGSFKLQSQIKKARLAAEAPPNHSGQANQPSPERDQNARFRNSRGAHQMRRRKGIRSQAQYQDRKRQNRRAHIAHGSPPMLFPANGFPNYGDFPTVHNRAFTRVFNGIRRVPNNKVDRPNRTLRKPLHCFASQLRPANAADGRPWPPE